MTFIQYFFNMVIKFIFKPSEIINKITSDDNPKYSLTKITLFLTAIITFLYYLCYVPALFILKTTGIAEGETLLMQYIFHYKNVYLWLIITFPVFYLMCFTILGSLNFFSLFSDIKKYSIEKFFTIFIFATLIPLILDLILEYFMVYYQFFNNLTVTPSWYQQLVTIIISIVAIWNAILYYLGNRIFLKEKIATSIISSLVTTACYGLLMVFWLT